MLCDLKPGGRYVAADLLPGGRRARGRQAPAGARPPERGRHDRHRPHHRRACRARPRRPRASASCSRSTSRSRPPAASRSCAATSPPTAAWSSSPATSACTTRAPPASSRRRRRRWRPSPRARSRRATSSSSATRVPPAAPACARCSRSPRRSWGRGSATTSRCITDGRFSGATHGFMVAPRRPRGGPRRPDRARCRRATRSPSTSPRAGSTSTLTDDEIATRLEAYEPPVRTLNGVFGKYAKLVSSASEGAVTR